VQHLATCAECRDEVRSLERVSLVLAAGAPRRTPPAALRERVLSVATGGASVSSAVRDTRNVGRVPLDPPSSGFDWTDSRVWLPVAALLVLSVGLGTYAWSLQSRVGALEARLDVALRQAQASRTALASAQTAAMGVQRTMAVLAAPDMARIDLAGQAVAPAARARAFWSRDRGLVVAANNLPPLKPGRTYQVWVLPASGAPISAGLLAPDASGVATVAYETASDLPTPAGVAVSEEQAGGVPSPTVEAILLVGKRSA
jgi:hypothetical protein